MERRELLKRSAALGALAALPFPLAAYDHGRDHQSEIPPRPLPRPAPGSKVPVAFLVSDGAVVIDFGGPWEVFNQVMPVSAGHGQMEMPFTTYTVSETTEPITAGGGLKVVPDYTLATAPAPKVIVIPAQIKASDAMLEWIRQSSRTADLTMSVCTGAMILAQTGLLAGRAATTHHGALIELALRYPDIHVKRGVRFVEDGAFASSGGLSCGIDLALRVVERYYDRETAQETADNLEYQGRGWLEPNNMTFRMPNYHTECAVCAMHIDAATDPHSVYKGKTYYFCMPEHKQLFDGAPERALS
jgi:transcriptional regulator GlxA family with amidase domain/YHS domain-containing protein